MGVTSNSLAESKTRSKPLANYDPNPEPRPEEFAPPWANYIPATDTLPKERTATKPSSGEIPEPPQARIIPPKPAGVKK